MNMLRSILLLTITAFFVNASYSQTTVFTYQGKLTDGVALANGTYQMQFSLYDASSGGAQIGSTVTNNSVSVTGGIFTVQLDFGPAAFDGTDRWLEIAVKKPAEASFTVLSPRQPVTSAPYAIKSQNSETADTATNSTQLGGVAANQYVVSSDPRMTDPRDPKPGSQSYIQNGTTPQDLSNFNITGDGTVAGNLNGNIVNATTQYNINNKKILSTPGSGPLNGGNLVGGQNAASLYIAGGNNTYFGTGAGFRHATGDGNSYFGGGAGLNIQSGSGNSFFGDGTGISIINAGDNNTFLGSIADGAQGISNATAIGANAKVTQSNSLVLGSINGVNGATADTNVGIGTTAPTSRLHVVGNGFFTGNLSSTSFFTNSINSAGSNLGIGTVSPQAKLDVAGTVRVQTLTTGFATEVCVDFNNILSNCSASSIRYKENIAGFRGGLDVVRQLRPVTFNWKQSGIADIGLIAEEVASVEPLLATRNGKGEVEGVKYNRIAVVLVNALKEQQEQIDKQNKQLVQQQLQIEKQQGQINDLAQFIHRRSRKTPVKRTMPSRRAK